MKNIGDESTSSECEAMLPSGHLNESDQVKSRIEQRFPNPGEPICVMCGKYGEYICNEVGYDFNFYVKCINKTFKLTLTESPFLPCTLISRL